MCPVMIEQIRISMKADWLISLWFFVRKKVTLNGNPLKVWYN